MASRTYVFAETVGELIEMLKKLPADTKVVAEESDMFSEGIFIEKGDDGEFILRNFYER